MQEQRPKEKAGEVVRAKPESLAERLEQAFGERVDPEISLQGGEPEGASPTAPLGEQDEGSKRLESTPSDATPPSGSLDPSLLELAIFDRKRRRYVPRGEIGRGGMGAVIEVWDRHLRRTLAMKVALEARSTDDEKATIDVKRVHRFLEEAQITSQLDHPGIVPVHEIGMDPGGQVYFTMRRVVGRDLEEVWKLAREEREGWSREQAVGSIRRICETLAYAHSKGVVHRDLKPSNIMVGSFGEVYVMDWGLAKVRGRDPFASREEATGPVDFVETDRAELKELDPGAELETLVGEVLGTPCYMAPEQAGRNPSKVGPWSDVYAVGCLLYLLLCGQRPYVPDDRKTNAWEVLNALRKGPPQRVHQLDRSAPVELVAICEKAMARSIGDRYSDLQEMAEDLRAYQEGRVVKAHAVGPLVEFRKWVGRNRAFATASVTVLALLVGSAIFFALERQSHARDLEAKSGESELARTRAESSEAEALRQEYAATISAAASAIRGVEVRETRRRLEQTPARLRGWEWRHLNLHADGSLLAQENVPGGVRAVAHHPLEDLVATGGDDGEIRIWNSVNGHELLTLDTHPGQRVVALSWNPSGSHLASASDAGSIRVRNWNAESTLDLEGHENAVTTLAFDAEGTHLLSAGDDFAMNLWNVESGERVATVRNPEGPFTAAALATQGDRGVYAAVGDKLLLWTPRTGKLLQIQRYPSVITALAVHAKGDVALGLESGLVVRQTRRSFAGLEGHSDRIEALRFDPSGRWLASASRDRTLRVWDFTRNRRRISQQLIGHAEAVVDASFDGSGSFLVSGSEDGGWRRWSLASCEAHTRLEGHDGAVHALQFDASGSSLLTASLDGSAGIWNPATATLRSFLRGPEDAMTSATFAPDEKHLATGAADGTIRLWDPALSTNVGVLHGHTLAVQALAASPDGRLLASGSWDGTIRLWNLDSQEQVATLEGHFEPVSGVAFHPGGRWLASCDRSGTILIHDLARRAVERTLSGHKGWVGAIAFHPLLPWLASGGRDETVRLWDLSDGKVLAVLHGHDAPVNDLAFDPEGSRLASASSDRTVRLWSTSARSALLALRGHSGAVNTVAFSPDGMRLASAADDGEVLLWETATPQERHEARLAAEQLELRAKKLVDDHFQQFFLASEVVDALRENTGLEEELRSAAIAMAFRRARSPRQLSQDSWRVVRLPGQQVKSYDRALRSARSARRGGRDDEQILSTLGAALYRTGKYADARAILEHALVLNQRLRRPESPSDLAFLAMSQWQVGDRPQARQTLSRLDSLLSNPTQRTDEEALELLAEARILIRE